MNDFIQQSGQAMYFDKNIARQMIERENNPDHILVSKIFEAILFCEFRGRSRLVIADLGAGAHTARYGKFLEFVKQGNGKIYWVDQSPFMLDYARSHVPEGLNNVLQFQEQEMTAFLRDRKDAFDGLVLKYSFNYLTPFDLLDWLKVMHASLKNGGKVVANVFYPGEKGLKPRSFNALYTIRGKAVRLGYKPKDGDVIEVHFLKKAGDQSLNPKTFAVTKIVYYSANFIREVAKKAGFSRVELFDDWQNDSAWQKMFNTLNPHLEVKAKPFLFLKK